MAVALVLAACGGADRKDYVSRNEAIVRSLPVFPGAVKIQEVSTPYVNSEAGSSEPSGYTTNVVFRVPAGVERTRVLRFSKSRLDRRGWQSHRIRRKTFPIVDFTRDGALVTVNDLLGSTLEILVDYRGADRAG